ncbi:MAG TPA: prolyl oligopeptidase family serine peptidase, partial [Pirellulales bacterium]|nr:prolyl oligopeptidase family serine peptidase [Pirellulales bacterium]
MIHRALSLIVVLSAVSASFAQPKLIPKLGIEVPPEKRAKLESQLKQLGDALGRLDGKRDAKAVATLSDARLKELLTDVFVFQRAVSDALTFNEFFAPKEIDAAESLLREGLDRAQQLAEGRADWTTSTGAVLRGYPSRIDGSVQPYVVIVPESYTPKASGHYRLDIWFHGRGETLSEVNFLNGLRTKPGQFTPPDTLVLHPYGRYCNAFKFAGETDVFEALEAVRANYRVDDDRTSVRGFSMGGAATWHFAVHHSDRWFAANPGAGFVDTAVYQKIFESGEPEPPWYEQRLWRWYDCPPYARNLYHCPTIAYSGEIDKQKAAADMMAEVLADYDISMAHIIGPKTEHKYHPDAAAEVSRRMASLAKFGRDQLPLSLQFDTQTLKYNRMYWVTIDGMGQHWETASVDAEVLDDGPAIETSNVTDLTLRFEPGESPFDITFPVIVSIDEQEFEVDHPLSDRSWTCQLHRVGQQWHVGA